MRIMVTNDDGIDSIGLHALARALLPLGEVIIVAPDGEYSGSGASLGAFDLIKPTAQVAHVDGVSEAFAVSGPPALCVLFARLGAFGPVPDLVVSGINPGANVGRSIYHSGTVGAAVTARNGGVSGIAVSQEVAQIGVEGQGGTAGLATQHWETAAAVGAEAARGLLGNTSGEALVLNLNVPNVPLGELKGWRYTQVGLVPSRALARATLERREGHEGSFSVVMEFGEPTTLPLELDGGAVGHGYVAASWLSPMRHERPGDEPAALHFERALSELLGPNAG